MTAQPARQVQQPFEDDGEAELIAAAQGGDSTALATLLERYQHRLFSVCMRMVGNPDFAADLTQDTFVRIIEHFGKYDGRAKLSTWMFRVTINVCLSKLRSEKLRRHASLDAPGAGEPGGPVDPRRGSAQGLELGPAGRVEQSDVRGLVSAALLRVSPEQRAILVLRDARGLEYEQIAEVLEVPVGTVKSRLFRAREALRAAVDELTRP